MSLRETLGYSSPGTLAYIHWRVFPVYYLPWPHQKRKLRNILFFRVFLRTCMANGSLGPKVAQSFQQLKICSLFENPVLSETRNASDLSALQSVLCAIGFSKTHIFGLIYFAFSSPHLSLSWTASVCGSLASLVFQHTPRAMLKLFPLPEALFPKKVWSLPSSLYAPTSIPVHCFPLSSFFHNI